MTSNMTTVQQRLASYSGMVARFAARLGLALAQKTDGLVAALALDEKKGKQLYFSVINAVEHGEIAELVLTIELLPHGKARRARILNYSKQGQAPLGLAMLGLRAEAASCGAMRGSAEVASLLLAAGASPILHDNDGEIPGFHRVFHRANTTNNLLDAALESRNLECIRVAFATTTRTQEINDKAFIFAAAISMEAMEIFSPSDDVYRNGIALKNAVMGNNERAELRVASILSKGSLVESNKHCHSPLGIAARRANISLVKLLVGSGSDILRQTDYGCPLFAVIGEKDDLWTQDPESTNESVRRLEILDFMLMKIIDDPRAPKEIASMSMWLSLRQTELNLQWNESADKKQNKQKKRRYDTSPTTSNGEQLSISLAFYAEAQKKLAQFSSKIAIQEPTEALLGKSNPQEEPAAGLLNVAAKVRSGKIHSGRRGEFTPRPIVPERNC